jgi:DNA repair exonuclease SbcCD ATPase subunit
MIIRSVKLRNFKKHQSLDLTFNEKLNLIGGPNEAGKSTIAEAIHAALFFKHSGNSKEQRELQSILSADGPSVELEFEINRQVYRLKKTFLRGSSCSLSSPGQQTLNGAAAEEALAGLLTSEGPLVSPSQAKGEWAHLWVWQGTAGNNPVQVLADQQSKMFAQLDSMGLMVAMASEKDQKVASDFTTRFEEIFTQQGRLRTNSKLAQVEQAFGEAQVNFSNLSQSIRLLEDGSTDYTEKKTQLKILKESLEGLNIEERDCLLELTKLQELETKLIHENSILENYSNREREIKEKIEAVNSLKSEIQQIEQNLNPLFETIQLLDQQIDDLKKDRKREEGALDNLIKDEVSLRHEFEFCQLQVGLENRKEEIKSLDSYLKKILEIKVGIDSYKTELGELPLIEQQHFDTWVKLESQVQHTKGILDAIATEVEVLSSDSQIEINSEVISGKVLLTAETILRSDGRNLLKITPGGGKNLAEATQDYEVAIQNFQEFKLGLGISEKNRAQEIVIKRDQLKISITKESAKLDALDPQEQVQNKKMNLEGELNQLDLQKNAIIELVPQLAGLKDIDFNQHGKKIRQKIEGISVEIQVKRVSIASINKKYEDLVSQKELNSSQSKSLTDLLTGKKSRWDLLDEQAGKEDDSIDKVHAKKLEQELVCREIQDQIEAMSPDQLKSRHQRIQQGLASQNQQYRELELVLAQLKGELNQWGDQNVYQDQQSVYVKTELLKGQLAGLRREAESIKLINQLFSDEQQELTRNYSAPFADKIQHYLSFIFGRNILVKIFSSPSGEFNRLEIYRDRYQELGAIEFDKLSGGTREQMAAAVRLAMAEVLATAYGGHLPIVFDDAFAYSDKDRLKVLPDMLYSASQKGLQIILLSCTPQDYASLGAHEISLSA